MRLPFASRRFEKSPVRQARQRQRRVVRERLLLAQPFPVEHEEQLVADDRTAQRRPVLVARKRRNRPVLRIEEILRVHLCITHELEHGSVERVRARFRARVDLRDGAAELGAEDARLDFELLERVDRRQQHVAVEVEVGVLDAVERIVVEVDALAGDVQRKAVALAAHPLLTLGRRGPVGRGAGNQRRELQVIAAVERQLDDAAVLDDGADRGVLRLDDRRVGNNRHDVGQLADCEREREAVRAAHLHVDVRLLGRREALELDLQRVVAGRHRRKHVNACLVALGQTDGVGGLVRQRHPDAGQHRSARVEDGPADFTGWGLRRRRNRERQKKKQTKQEPITHVQTSKNLEREWPWIM